MKKQDEWEKSVGDQLRERRISPRPELWERVNQELDQLPVEEEEAKAFPWRWAAVFLALVGMASLYWMSQGGEEQETSLPALVEKELPREMTEPVATTPIEVTEVEQPDQAVDQREIAQAEETVPTPLEDQKRDQGLTEIAQAEQLQPSSLDQMIEEKSKALIDPADCRSLHGTCEQGRKYREDDQSRREHGCKSRDHRQFASVAEEIF